MMRFRLNPSVRLLLDGEAVASYLYGPLHRFVLGSALSADIEAAHGRLLAEHAHGGDWWRRAGAEHWFERAEEHDACFLRPEYYYRPTPSLFDEPLAVVAVDVERRRKFRIPLTVERLAALRAVLSAARVYDPGVAFDRAEVELAHELLERGILLPVAPGADVPGARPQDIVLTKIAHACIMLDSPRARVIFDPVLTFRRRWGFFAEQALERPVDAVVISHCHFDHFHLDSLLLLDRRTKIIIPAAQGPRSIANLDMAKMCGELGFEDVIQLEAWESTTVRDIEVTATPFHGEPHGPDSVLDRMTYAVRHGGRVLYGAVDTIADSFGRADDVIAEVRARFGRIDVLLVPASGISKQYADLHRRPFFLGRGVEPSTGGPEDVVRWTALAHPEVVIPYALFDFVPRAEMAWSDSGPTGELKTGDPTQLRDRLAGPPSGPLRLLDLGDRLELRPGRLSATGADESSEVSVAS